MASSMISDSEFAALVKRHKIRGKKTIKALRNVKCNGLSQAEAARLAKIGEGAVSRAVARVERPVCEHCGSPIDA